MARDYGRVYTAFWNSQDVRGLSDQAKLLANYLITGPHSNSIGAYLLPDAYVSDDLEWSAATVSKAFVELFRNGFATRFRDGRHICINKFLTWNPIENPNVGKAALKQLDQLPDDPALEHVLKGLMLHDKHFPNGIETVHERFRNIEIEPKPEIEPEPKPESIARSARSKPISKNILNGHEKDFDEFYAVFPKHVAKAQAQKAYAKALERADPLVILDGARRYRRSREGEEQQFTKNPGTWLTADCWLDEGQLADGLAPNPELARIEEIEAAFRKEKGYE